MLRIAVDGDGAPHRYKRKMLPRARAANILFIYMIGEWEVTEGVGLMTRFGDIPHAPRGCLRFFVFTQRLCVRIIIAEAWRKSFSKGTSVGVRVDETRVPHRVHSRR